MKDRVLRRCKIDAEDSVLCTEDEASVVCYADESDKAEDGIAVSPTSKRTVKSSEQGRTADA